MPETLLTILKFLLVALVYLFFIRVLRAVWAEVATSRAPAPAPAAPAAAPRRDRGSRPVRLRVAEPAEQRGRTFELDEEVTVGRADGCRVRVDDTYASQLHARVYQRDGDFIVEDLGSTNGTYVNGNRISAPTPLKRGDKLKVGKTVLEVVR